MTPQFIVSAPTSGAGKTTVCRGLMGLLVSHGLKVQPFKCGPDYIDTKFHGDVCGRPSVNIDMFFVDAAEARRLYSRYAADADAVVVEGMMGMYDGYDRSLGSTYEVAQALGLPVVLVVDARSAAYSLTPLLWGFAHFRDDVTIAGVIFNRVGSERHAAMLRQVCDDTHLTCYGCLPRMADEEVKSRYLGLDFSQKTDSGTLVATMERAIDWRRLLDDTAKPQPQPSAKPQHKGDKRIVVARNDEAFSFVYQQTLDLFGEYGEVELFNPEADKPLPHSTDLLYLPGGYPEKHADALVSAQTTRRTIADYAAQGGRILAECGGMMYLCNKIVTDDGEREMCGVLPYSVTARHSDRKLSLGYRQFALDGMTVRGHEFHYSQFLGDLPHSAVQVYNAKGDAVATPVIRQGGVTASYTHLYMNDELIRTLLK